VHSVRIISSRFALAARCKILHYLLLGEVGGRFAGLSLWDVLLCIEALNPVGFRVLQCVPKYLTEVNFKQVLNEKLLHKEQHLAT